MKYHRIAGSDLEVSAICLGTMTWGGQNSGEEAGWQMDLALDEGINFFDTAELYAVPPSPASYGSTETIIGQWFQKTGNRSRVILASKVAGSGMHWIRERYYRIDGKNIRLALEESLRRLQTDYIDLYQLHWPNRPNYHFGHYFDYDPTGVDRQKERENFLESLNTLNNLIKEGKIRHVGLSNETAWGVMNWLEIARANNLPAMVTIQNEYSLLNRSFEPELAEVSLRENIGLLAWSPLATGLLTGKYRNGKRPAGSRWQNQKARHNRRDTVQAHRAVDGYLQVAKKYGMSPATMALAFVNSRPFIAATIIGATGVEQLKENIASIHVKLPDELLHDLELVRRDFPVPF